MQPDPDAGNPTTPVSGEGDDDDFIVARRFDGPDEVLFSGAYVRQLLEEVAALRRRIVDLELVLASKGR